jgi:Transaldolase/Fructose-6-phosphate aldolase
VAAVGESRCRSQRLLFASTGTKDPKASDVLYISALAAPNTINTMSEKTLLAFSEHGTIAGTLPKGGGDCEHFLVGCRNADIDLDKLAADLQSQGAKAFDESWSKLLSALGGWLVRFRRRISARPLPSSTAKPSWAEPGSLRVLSRARPSAKQRSLSRACARVSFERLISRFVAAQPSVTFYATSDT